MPPQTAGSSIAFTMGSLFGFVQFEFTHAIGPHAGRYVVAHPALVDADGAALRAEELPRRQALTGVTMEPAMADVLAITVLAAPAARQKLRRRSKEVEAVDKPAEVPILLATFVRGTEPIKDAARADELLEAIANDEDSQQAWIAEGLEVLNRAIRAYRAGAHDPYVTEVAHRDARRVRIGYGAADEVADAGWTRAIVLPPLAGGKGSRAERLAPSEVTADVLAGRGTVLESEDVLLRAWVDLDHDRPRAAALQAQAALRLLAIELPDADLDDLRERAATLLAAALEDAGGTTLVEELERLLAKVDRSIERWRYEALAPTKSAS
jgi:hypothetical protein